MSVDFEQTLLECGGIECGDCHPPRYLSTGRPVEADLELGIFPAIAAAIPMVANLAGSLMSKKSSKGGGPPPEAGTAQNVLDVLTKAIGGDEGKGESSIKEVVRNIVATVPSPVLNQVKDAIKQLKNADKASVAARDLIVNKVDSRFGPQIHAMLAGLKAQQLQRQATYEHNRIKARDKFRKDTTSSLESINRRLAEIQARLNNSAIAQGSTQIALLGGRRVIER